MNDQHEPDAPEAEPRLRIKHRDLSNRPINPAVARMPEPRRTWHMPRFLVKLIKFVVFVLLPVAIAAAVLYKIDLGDDTRARAWRDGLGALKTLQEDSHDAQAIAALTPVVKVIQGKDEKGDAMVGLMTISALGRIYMGEVKFGPPACTFIRKTYPESPFAAFADLSSLWSKCPACKGSSRLRCTVCDGSGKCPTCKGTGQQTSMIKPSKPKLKSTGLKKPTTTQTIRRLGSLGGVGEGSLNAACSFCRGSGECPKCRGNGSLALECIECGGSGRMISPEKAQQPLEAAIEKAIRPVTIEEKKGQVQLVLIYLQSRLRTLVAEAFPPADEAEPEAPASAAAPSEPVVPATN